MAEFHLKLSQDGVAKGLGGDASAVRHKENGGVGHEKLSIGITGQDRGGGLWATYNAPLSEFRHADCSTHSKNYKVAALHGSPVLTFGACL
jgi:hypothetical protein